MGSEWHEKWDLMMDLSGILSWHFSDVSKLQFELKEFVEDCRCSCKINKTHVVFLLRVHRDTVSLQIQKLHAVSITGDD